MVEIIRIRTYVVNGTRIMNVRRLPVAMQMTKAEAEEYRKAIVKELRGENPWHEVEVMFDYKCLTNIVLK